mgnify:CR=1 FL=1
MFDTEKLKPAIRIGRTGDRPCRHIASHALESHLGVRHRSAALRDVEDLPLHLAGASDREGEERNRDGE